MDSTATPRRIRRPAMVLALALALVLAVTGPAAPAHTTTATTVSGWSTAPATLTAPASWSRTVTVSGPVGRKVLLQYWNGRAWTSFSARSTDRYHRATVVGRTTATRMWRVYVPAAGAWAARATAARTIRLAAPIIDKTPPGSVHQLGIDSWYAWPRISLGWLFPVFADGRIDTDISGFIVRRADGPTPPEKPTDGIGIPVANIDRDIMSANVVDEDAEMPFGATYSYAVFAVDKAGNIGPAATATATTMTGEGDPEAAASASSYRYMVSSSGPIGHGANPMHYDRCLPIRYVIDASALPPDQQTVEIARVQAAVAEIAAASADPDGPGPLGDGAGYTFEYVGTATVDHAAVNQGSTYAATGSNLVILFAPAEEMWGVEGWGGQGEAVRWEHDGITDWWWRGYAMLNATTVSEGGWPDREKYTLYLHEILHGLNVGHTDDESQVMFFALEAWRRHLGIGDRTAVFNLAHTPGGNTC